MKILSIILGIFFLSIFVNPAFAESDSAFASDPDSIGTSYTYTNQEQDESGLMHYDSRYYDPELGRFLQPDTLDIANKYSYVNNDPVNKIDPTGHFEVPTADQFYDSSYLFYENSYAFSGIDPTNTDTYSAMFSDPLTIDNNFIVGDMVGPWGDLGSNLYLDAADDIAKERAYYQSNDARFILSYEDYKRGVHPLYVDSSFGVNPVGMAGGIGKSIGLLGFPKGVKDPTRLYLIENTKDINQNILNIRRELFGNIADDATRINIRRSTDFGVAVKDIVEIPLSEIYGIHDITSQSIKTATGYIRGPEGVKDLVFQMQSNGYDLRYPIILFPKYRMYELGWGYHRTAAMGVLGQETIPAVIIKK